MALRRSLFITNPHCHWCKKLTVWSGGSLDDLATIDHVKCRGEARSIVEYSAAANKVLACHKCNQKRNADFTKATVGKVLFYVKGPADGALTPKRHKPVAIPREVFPPERWKETMERECPPPKQLKPSGPAKPFSSALDRNCPAWEHSVFRDLSGILKV